MPNRNQFNTNEEYNQWFRDYRKLYPKKIREYNRNYNAKWRKMFGYDSERRYAKKYPEKIKAQRLLQYAVRTKFLKKLPCEKCGDINSQGHHPDYSKPLEVKWLCPLHHKDEHRIIYD